MRGLRSVAITQHIVCGTNQIFINGSATAHKQGALMNAVRHISRDNILPYQLRKQHLS